MFLLNGQPLQIDVPFMHDGTAYPANWLRLTSLAEKEAIGITEVADETTHYDDRFYWNATTPKQLNDETVTPEGGTPYVQKGLKSQWTAQVKDTANKLLAASDWMVIRKVERNVDIPAATVTFRAAVVTEVERLKTAIAGATDVTAFIAVVTAQNWPVTGV